MVFYLIISGQTAYFREKRLTAGPDLYYFSLMFLYLCLNATLLRHILIILLDCLLHGEDLTLFAFELFEKHTKRSFLERLFKISLFFVILRKGKDGLEGWIVTIVVLQKFVLV